MKKIAATIAALIAFLQIICATGSPRQYSDDWYSDKYSMFIHFGLYSHLGGVWEGEPVRQGYSEQIQSFAGIFSDWYAETAYEFRPDLFDADEIVKLAQEAGMRSIVFTSKHHDGFCMYDTETTSYNSMDMLGEGRDFVKELSQACERHGLNFGLYFSLIDWNYPHAYPISSHNADFVTPEHHEFSKAQIRELLTSYGEISELWFDMGALEPWQSREMYDLVKSLQPQCMVSGRLGNDIYDFAVMADNKLPQNSLHAPWQSAASMFPETWSYRSWQDRGEVKDKVAEKLRTLIKVVSRGGNYLLNIGPAADGSVVPFERDVLLMMGKWLEENGDAVYGTEASPFSDEFEWGNITVKDNVMNLLLTGTYPEEGRIYLPLKGFRLNSAEGAVAYVKGHQCVVELDREMYSDPVDIHVVSLDLDRPLDNLAQSLPLSQYEEMSWMNAYKEYSYSCFDYYSNYQSTVSYTWTVNVKRPVDGLEILYTSDEEGRDIVLEVGGEKMALTLSSTGAIALSDGLDISEYGFARLRGGVFDGSATWEKYDCSNMPASESLVDAPAHPFENYLMRSVVNVDKAGVYVLDVTGGNGVEVIVDGRIMTKHLNPYRTVRQTEKILLDLSEGETEIKVRSYNRFETRIACGVKVSEEQKVNVMKVALPVNRGTQEIKIYAGDRSGHSDCGLHNLRVRL